MIGVDADLDLVTGAFSYSGARIAARLLDSGRGVRTLTFHPDRSHPLQRRVQAEPYRFDDPVALAQSLEGVSTLYNTYWVRFDHGDTTFANAIANSRALFCAARRAGVSRIVHVSIANPSVESTLPYYRGKALVELALAEAGVPYSVVRPTLVFGGEPRRARQQHRLDPAADAGLRAAGDGGYEVQPVHVDDLARICVESADVDGDDVVDAAGPETMSFAELVRAVRRAIGARSPILRLPPPSWQRPHVRWACSSATSS